LSVIVCAAAPAADAGILVREAIARGWTVQVISTPSALPFLDADEIARLEEPYVPHPVLGHF
jgi:hypothetical protein